MAVHRTSHVLTAVRWHCTKGFTGTVCLPRKDAREVFSFLESQYHLGELLHVLDVDGLASMSGDEVYAAAA